MGVIFRLGLYAMMIKGSDITINVIASIIASVILLIAGFLWGKYKERRRFGRNLEEYDFYPFTINRDNLPEFNLKDFRLGVHYFLKNNDYLAARQLIFIGEQNNVRAQLEPVRTKGLRRALRKVRWKKDRGRYKRVPGKLHSNCPTNRQVVSEYRRRNPPA
jgi:hypothetical protein